MRERARSPSGLALAIAALLLACGGDEGANGPALPGAAWAPNGRLHLVVIVVDTLRADHLGYHGYDRGTSPTLDALAAESAVFLRHTSHASRTGPSVATLITGLHARSHGVVNPLTHFDAIGTLAKDKLTLAEILAARGYRSAAFAANTNLAPRFGFAQGYGLYTLLGWKNAEAVNRLAFEWLDKRRADDPRPFFLYVHYIDPHSPYQAPERYTARFADPAYDGPVTGAHRQLDRAILEEKAFDSSDLAELRARYDAEIAYVDAQIAKLLARLEQRGLLDRSLVVFLSDHGEEFQEHGSLLHGYTLYQEQLRVPLLFRHPELPARRIAARSRQVDVLPTILELLGVPPPEGLQGRSLVPLLRGASEPEEARPIFAQASLRAVKIVQLESYTEGPWKLIATSVPEPREQLFHLVDDPGETRDRLGSDPEQAARLRRALRRFRDSLPRGERAPVALSEEEQEQLRAMGYLPPRASEQETGGAHP